MKKVYLQRAVISGLLWLAMIAIVALGNPETGSIFLVLIPAFALAILLGKAIMETVSAMTGLTFLFSGFGLLIFYVLMISFSVIVAPLYCLWNVARFFLTADAA